MGQQQLILLVLGVVLVGIAIVAGISVYSEGTARAQLDAAMRDATGIVSDAQAWKLKPAAFGGGGDEAEADFSKASLRALGYDVGSLTEPHFTTNGCYAFEGTTAGALITVYTDSTSGACDPSTEIALITVMGTDEDDVLWAF